MTKPPHLHRKKPPFSLTTHKNPSKLNLLHPFRTQSHSKPKKITEKSHKKYNKERNSPKSDLLRFSKQIKRKCRLSTLCFAEIARNIVVGKKKSSPAHCFGGSWRSCRSTLPSKFTINYEIATSLDCVIFLLSDSYPALVLFILWRKYGFFGTTKLIKVYFVPIKLITRKIIVTPFHLILIHPLLKLITRKIIIFLQIMSNIQNSNPDFFSLSWSIFFLEKNSCK